MIEYRGYTGVFEFDPSLALFAGHVIDLQDEIYFEGVSVEEITASMRRAVDHYLEVCDARGEEAGKPFSGRFNVRMDPNVHRQVASAAAAAGLSMNEWMTGLIESGLSAIDREAAVLVLDDFRERGGPKPKSKTKPRDRSDRRTKGQQTQRTGPASSLAAVGTTSAGKGSRGSAPKGGGSSKH